MSNNNNSVEKSLRIAYRKADVKLNGVIVMVNGRIIGEVGKEWWEDKIEKHRRWLRKEKRKNMVLE